MKDVISLSEHLRRKEEAAIQEGLLSNISNLFAPNYKLKNPVLKELLREVDCPISWKETKLRNSVLKLVDEFVASQSKAYAEELTTAKDKDDKEEAGEMVLDSETRFGSLKSKRLVEKAQATLSALKNLVASSKTAKEDAARWVQVVYDEAVIATIQTALESADIDKTVKEAEMSSLEKAQAKLDDEKKTTHEKNTKEFTQWYDKIDTTAMNDYKVVYEDGSKTFKEITSGIKSRGAKVFDGAVEKFGLADGKMVDNAAAVLVVAGLSGAINEASNKDLVDKIMKSDGGEKNVVAAYRTADYIIYQLASSKCNNHMLSGFKQFSTSKSFGDVSSLIDRLVGYAAQVAKTFVKNGDNDISDAAENITANYKKYWDK